MSAPETHDVTALLIDWRGGDAAAVEKLMPLVHGELRRIAKRHMAGERQGHVLQATALVNEVYLRLIDVRRVQWQDRAHFFAVAARLMRRVLVDFARAQRNQKRGGALHRVTLDPDLPVASGTPVDLIAIDEALQALSETYERKAQVGVSSVSTSRSAHLIAPVPPGCGASSSRPRAADPPLLLHRCRRLLRGWHARRQLHDADVAKVNLRTLRLQAQIPLLLRRM